MTTLADLTPEERANCPGMWATSFIGYTGVIVYSNDKQAYLIIPEYNREQTFPLDEVTPRPDLPRAWQADGTPPEGEWQTAKTKIALNENAKYDPEQNVITGDGVADPDHEPRSSHDIRRWIGEWEQA